MTTGLRVLFATADRTLAKGLHRGSPHTLQAVVGPSKVYMYSAATCLTISNYPTVLFVLQTTRSLATTKLSLMIILFPVCSAVPVIGSYMPRVRGLSLKQYRTRLQRLLSSPIAHINHQSLGYVTYLSRIQAPRFCSSQVVR